MSLREDIKHDLGLVYTGGELERLYSCFTFKNDPAYERIKLQTWFQGCIESLFYRPNKYCLVLSGKQGIGKTEFFRRISPNKNWLTQSSNIRDMEKLCMDFLFVMVDEELYSYSKVKQMRTLCQSQNFVIYDGDEFPECDKRLASYCGTVNEWPHPSCKWDLVIEIESIDWQMFNSIDKNLLWSELFHKFKLR